MIFKEQYPDKPNQSGLVKNLVWDLTRIGFRFSYRIEGETVLTEPDNLFLVRIQAETGAGNDIPVRAALVEIEEDSELVKLEYNHGLRLWTGTGPDGKALKGNALPAFFEKVKSLLEFSDQLPCSESKRRMLYTKAFKEAGWDFYNTNSFDKSVISGPGKILCLIYLWSTKESNYFNCRAYLVASESGRPASGIDTRFEINTNGLRSDVDFWVNQIKSGGFEAKLTRLLVIAHARAFLSALKALKPEKVQGLGKNRRQADFEDGRHIVYLFTDKGIVWAAGDRQNRAEPEDCKTWVPEDFDEWNGKEGGAE